MTRVVVCAIVCYDAWLAFAHLSYLLRAASHINLPKLPSLNNYINEQKLSPADRAPAGGMSGFTKHIYRDVLKNSFE